MLVLLPLIIKYFDDVQVASWFLFTSVLFFSNELANQARYVMARMVAQVAGGAESLAPITGNQHKSTSGQTNWELMRTLYPMTQSFAAVLAVIGLLLGVLLGYFSLDKILHDYVHASDVWWAFVIFLAGSTLSIFNLKYQVVLRGLNQVALTSRWNAIFSVASPCAGALTLALGGGIIAVSIVMQAFVVLTSIRMWVLLNIVVEPRFREMTFWGWNKQVAAWVVQPMVRGLMQSMAFRGSTKICMVVLARHADPPTLSFVLIVLRILESVGSVAATPLTSHVPRFARLLAAGKIDDFSKAYLKKLSLSMGVATLGCIAVPLGIYFILALLDAKFTAQSTACLLVFSGLYLVSWTVQLSLMITIIGNQVIATGRMVVSAALSIALAFTLIPLWPVAGIIISSYIPIILIVNIMPTQVGSKRLAISTLDLVKRFSAIPAAAYTVTALIALLLPWQAWTSQWGSEMRIFIDSLK